LKGTHGDYIRAKNKEDFTKDGGILDQYIDDLATSRATITATLIDEI
jgi:hypothetical protein